MTFCPKCGNENKGEAKICEKCGENFEIIEPAHKELSILGFGAAFLGAFFGLISVIGFLFVRIGIELGILGFGAAFLGALFGLIMGIYLYSRKNPKDKKNGLYIAILSITFILLIVIAVVSLVIIYSYHSIL